ncbi:MAG TPA: GerAB/ArcD/ProY family transporter [Oscillospiraceae bacterium]|nr:GerAB/ArcD/ProY family transporter [Oscillospiraceae bacterium]
MDRSVTVRQFFALAFVTMLSPAILFLSQRTAAAAGTAGWVSVLAAAPILAALVWLFRALLGPGEGLADALCRAWGETAGRGVCLLYAAWLTVLCAAALRFGGERLLSAAYADVPLWVILVPVLALSVWMALLPTAAFARMAEIGYLILAAVLAAVLLLSLGNVDVKNLLPVLPGDAEGVLPAVSATLDAAACGAYVCFLAGELRKRPEKRETRRWILRAAGFLLLLQIVSFGVFGAGLLSRMQAPLFLAAREISVLGVFGRLEAVVVSLWVLTDLITLAVLLRGVRRALARAADIRGAAAVVPAALLALLLAYLLAPDAFGLAAVARGPLRWLNLGFAVALPGLSLLPGRLRKRI